MLRPTRLRLSLWQTQKTLRPKQQRPQRKQKWRLLSKAEKMLWQHLRRLTLRTKRIQMMKRSRQQELRRLQTI